MRNSVYEEFLKEIEYQNQRWSNKQYAILIEVIPWVTNYDQELWDTICASYYHDIDELAEAPLVVVDGKTYKWHEDVMDALGDGFTMKMLPVMLELGATVRPTYYINTPDERVRYFFDVIILGTRNGNSLTNFSMPSEVEIIRGDYYALPCS